MQDHWRVVKKSPGKKFTIYNTHDKDPHTFMDLDMSWAVVDTSTGKTIFSIKGGGYSETYTQEVRFSEDGKEVLAINGNDEIKKRYELPE